MGRGGLIAAGLVLASLILGGAAFVFGVEGNAQKAEPAEAAKKISSLAVPPRPPSGFRNLPSAELAEMIELTDNGLRLPRISPSGWMPWIAHARRFDPSGPAARVGVLMINLGADEALTRRAIEELPGDVSLAFLAGAPDLPRWLRQARERGHESYLMLPMEDQGPAERGIRSIQAAADPTENLRRLLAVMARGEGYVGLVTVSAGPLTQSDAAARPLVKEIADRGLALIEIDPGQASTVLQQLTAELGAGYARTANVLDYRLVGGGVGGNLDRLTAWAADTAAEQPPRHGFGVVQPDDAAIEAIVAWFKRRPEGPAVSVVPIIGHFECREACMARMRLQPAQLRP
jgi:polysaccharide deacetylase 2 family uncharacterized protein YibQ